MRHSRSDKYVAYYWAGQESGNGIAGQRKAVGEYLEARKLVREFVDVRPDDGPDHRPKLEEAVRWCRAHRATIVIGNLGRLANAGLISDLIESGVDFVAADMPTANRLIPMLMDALTEQQREIASQRTKAALAAAKGRGVKLGTYSRILSRRNRAAALKRADEMRSTIKELRAHGITTVRGIAQALNEREVPTPRGGLWHPNSVDRLLKRL